MKSNKIKFQIIFFIGPPGSGKDTQGKLLAKRFKGKFIATSELLINFFEKTKKQYLKIKNKILNLKEEKEKLKRGALNDPYLVIHIILERIKEALKKKEILIISGSPRRLPEAKEEFYFLNRFLPEKFIFIFLDIGQKEIFRRLLKRKREDDTPEIIKTRIGYYKKETLPAINFLKKKGVLVRINGEGTVLQIHRQILKKLML